MKYLDIPKFTKTCSYRVHSELRWFLDTIEKYIEDGLELNPDFQRGHVWTEAQQIAFMEYLLAGGSSGREIYLNDNEYYGVKRLFVCVDGLQRITAVLRFLKNEIKVYGNKFCDFNGKIPYEYGLYINVNNLETKDEILKWYLEMNSGGTPHTKKELDRVKALMDCKQI